MDWNERYHQDDTPWDKGAATPVLEELLKHHPERFTAKRILVPGCGTGHDVRWLAGQEARVTGVDIAPLAIKRAQDLDPTGMAHYELADFLDPHSAFENTFDQVWEHTCFCALHPTLRRAYLTAAYRALKPGGQLIGVFFINPEMEEGEEGPPFGIHVEDLENLTTQAGFSIVEAWVPETGFPGRIGRERVMILNKI